MPNHSNAKMKSNSIEKHMLFIFSMTLEFYWDRFILYTKSNLIPLNKAEWENVILYFFLLQKKGYFLKIGGFTLVLILFFYLRVAQFSDTQTYKF